MDRYNLKHVLNDYDKSTSFDSKLSNDGEWVKYSDVEGLETECVWTESGLVSHKTSCGVSFLVNSKFKFCPFCGGLIKIIALEEG